MTTTELVRDDEFYIGYESEMPSGIARRVRMAVLASACVSVAVAVIVVFATSLLPPSRFEFGTVKDIGGHLHRAPYPVLETRSGRVWLAGAGKSGADAMLAGVADGPVTLRGSRIHRGRHEMLEVSAIVTAGAGAPPAGAGAPPARSRARSAEGTSITLRGEIVDSKCFLGVMNPAEGAVHRDCARRCLSGGLPPMLLVRDGRQREELVVLTTSSGSPSARELASFAGAPVDVTGRLVREGGEYVMLVESVRKR